MCYDWIDNPEKLKYLGLPPISEFFNKLKGENIDEKTYDHAKKVYKEFCCANFGEYLMIYLKMVSSFILTIQTKIHALIMFIWQDVLILQEITSHFSQLCGELLGIFPEHYQSLPGLSFDAGDNRV